MILFLLLKRFFWFFFDLTYKCILCREKLQEVSRLPLTGSKEKPTRIERKGKETLVSPGGGGMDSARPASYLFKSKTSTTRVQRCGRMDKWIDGWIDGLMDGGMDG